jgi:hypothetical protein
MTFRKDPFFFSSIQVAESPGWRMASALADGPLNPWDRVNASGCTYKPVQQLKWR